MTAERLFPDRAETQALQEAHGFVLEAQAQYEPIKTFVMFSGGNDSLVLLDVAWRFADAIFHINTDFGIDEAHEFAREAARRYRLPFLEYHPPKSYEWCCENIWSGFPGPGMHNQVWQRLKERCIEQLWRDTPHRRGDRYLLLSGIRRDESGRRKDRPVMDRKGARVMVKPLVNWHNHELDTYRLTHRLPINPVARELHMSGECMCGAMADQGLSREERWLLGISFPKFEARISALEERFRALGLRYPEWGVKRPDCQEPDEDHPGCDDCPLRLAL